MAPESAINSSQKRKALSDDQAGDSAARKRKKTQAIRAIPSQSSDAALSKAGELDVAMFVKAREFEIKALEGSMQNSRHGLATRAFQQVPRNMRRRTASHNVKKVPRRLRRRAEREMKEDNTPTVTSRRRTPSSKTRLRLETAKRIKATHAKPKTITAKKRTKKHSSSESNPDPEPTPLSMPIPTIKKNRLVEPPKATSKFKRRQIHKTWLPTHLWHAKRAHMTKPAEPLWRMAIPLGPTEKSFRPSHRSSVSRGAVAWDMSYMATIGCEGVDSSLEAILKAIGFNEHDAGSKKSQKWRRGTRSVVGWVREKDGKRRIIGPITALWAADLQNTFKTATNQDTEGSTDMKMTDPVAQSTAASKPPQHKKTARRRIFLRVHPSFFHQLWTEISSLARSQRPTVVIEDLRFEIASIDIIGPGSTEALNAVLQPITSDGTDTTRSAQTWKKLSGLTNPASLPMGALLSFTVSDPRLDHPKRPSLIHANGEYGDGLTELVVDWPPDDEPPDTSIFSQSARITTSRSLPSQKAINRRRSLAQPFEAPPPRDTDPKIPIILLASRSSRSAAGAQGSWTLLLPWKCLDPIWRCLMYYPLSSGGNVRFGGLEETRQVAFEQSRPWFPGDFPGTEAGRVWERSEAENRHKKWESRPPSRRVNYDLLDLGNDVKGEHGRGWACDWESMFSSVKGEAQVSAAGETQSGNKSGTDMTRATYDSTARSDHLDQARDAVNTYTQLPPNEAVTILRPSASLAVSLVPSKPLLATIRLTLLTRGSPLPCARIYRLPWPHADATISRVRDHWLSLDPHPILTNPRTKMKKIKTNHRGEPLAHFAYAVEDADLDAIECKPPGMVPAAIAELEKTRAASRARRDKFLARKLKTGRHSNDEVSKQGRVNRPGTKYDDDRDGREEDGQGPISVDQQEQLLQDLMRPCADGSDATAAASLPCPPASDLIGFVTTGGYNLSAGRGTAIGAVWVQRVLEGWQRREKMGGGKESKEQLSGSNRRGEQQQQQQQKQLERKKRLCIVRNAGESVARLAIWEVCE